MSAVAPVVPEDDYTTAMFEGGSRLKIYIGAWLSGCGWSRLAARYLTRSLLRRPFAPPPRRRPASANVGNAPVAELDSWVPRHAPHTDLVVFGMQESTYGSAEAADQSAIDPAVAKALEKEVGRASQCALVACGEAPFHARLPGAPPRPAGGICLDHVARRRRARARGSSGEAGS